MTKSTSPIPNFGNCKVSSTFNPVQINIMKKLQHRFAAALAVIGSAVALHAAQPVAVSVHFSSNGNDNGFANGAANALQSADQAGAPGYATTNWNNLGRWGDVNSGIIDYTGADSGLHLQWDSVWSHSSGAFANLATPDSALMDGCDDTDWGGGPPGPWTAGATYGASANQKPAEYVGGIQSWLATQGKTNGYSVVLYVQGWHGWGGTSEHWVQAVTGGNPNWWNMSVGGDVTPHLFCTDNGPFNGTYSQVPPSSASYANRTGSGNYIVFNGLTNDAILIRNAEPTGDYQAGKIFGFQIIATPDQPITMAPTISPNPAYATSPVSLSEAAYSPFAMTYQWQTDGGSGGSLTNIPSATSSNPTCNDWARQESIVTGRRSTRCAVAMIWSWPRAAAA